MSIQTYANSDMAFICAILADLGLTPEQVVALAHDLPGEYAAQLEEAA